MVAFSSGVQVRRFLLMCIVYLIFWILCPTICEHYIEMDSLGEKEQWKLNFLANAENFELKEIASIETPVRSIDIANIQLIVWLIPAESKVFAEDFFAKFYDVTIVGTTLALCR
ncbi:hypothetical protein ACWI_11570 [Acetobacterium wieringae]|uniref:Uncharacterized protein n=1 Tax=Acetobacterium wieringae TaxID=52694 RepID=A0A1F2PIT3_9FIRM|nr:hypothetical protein ACWI_11570 [Acetobacterium wieringae]